MDWFRMDSDFTRHPKVGALAKRLDVNRYLVIGHLTCLLCGVAEHAEDGSLMSVNDETIAVWGEWHGDVKKFSDALRFVGVISEKKREIHGWKERHEYMLRERNRKAEFDKRRKKSARVPRARRARIPYRTVPIDDATHHHPSASPTADLFGRWDGLAKELGLPVATKVTARRAAAARLRIAEGLLDRWPAFEAALRASPFHLGQNDRGWKANPEWLLRPGKWLEMAERGSAPLTPQKPQRKSPIEIMHEAEARVAANGGIAP